MYCPCLLTVSHSIPCILRGGSAHPPNADPHVGRPRGVCPTPPPPWMQTLGSTPPWKQTPLWSCDACWEATPPCGQTNTCDNITLPQTSFAGGNYPWVTLRVSGMCKTFFYRTRRRLWLRNNHEYQPIPAPGTMPVMK